MKYALINVPIARIMLETSYEGETQDEALYGMVVEILSATMDKNNEEWCLIKTHYNYEGLVKRSQLITESELVESWSKTPKKIVLKAFADVLSEPRAQGYIMAELTRGAVVTPLQSADKEGWFPVALCDGRTGFIRDTSIGEYITTWHRENEENLRNDIVKTAFSYLGTSYRWGGKSPFGIDCSGFCSMCYMINGIIIYRDAVIKEGFPMKEIPRESMKKGDLIYFPHHVAMYIGNDKFIHSTARKGSNGVVVNSLNPKDQDFLGDLLTNIKYIGSIF